MASAVKNLPANKGDIRDAVLIPGSGRSPGGGHGNLLQDSCLEIPWREESGGLQSIESQRVGYKGNYLACIVYRGSFKNMIQMNLFTK